MAFPPRAIALHLLLLFLFAMAAATTRIATAETASAAAAAAPSAAGTQSATSASVFLRACCATTLYPAVCYDSLLPNAATFQTSHVRLARAAADVAAAHLHAFSARVKDLLHRGSGGAAAALHDCASTISAAANLARQSSAELTRLDADGSMSAAAASAGGSRLARWKVSNAQTWLSAAMTDEGTCADGFADAGGAAMASPAGKEVAAGVATVRQYTSNALALVNGIPL